MFGQQNLSSLSPQEFCNFLETRPNSDQIKSSIGDQILLSGSILWFWWHARFSGLANSGHAQKPFFTSSNEPNIFALLPPDVGFAWGVHLTKCNPRYWRRCGIRGTFVLLREANLPIHQTLLPLPIVNLNIISHFFPNTDKNVTKSTIWLYHHHYKEVNSVTGNV